jgi:hypothetical protein
LNSLNELEKGDLIVVDVVSNIPKPPRNYKTRGISYGNSKIPRLKQKPKRIKRKETFSKPNLLLTPKGLFSQVKKTGDVKVWKREDDGQVIGPILPSLDIRPITKKLVKVIPKQSFNTQPIPRLRYQPLLPQTKNRKHELIQRLKIQQEQLHSRVQESHLVDVNIHRLIKTADVLSLYQFDHFKPEETKPMTALPYIKAQFKNSRRDINTAPIYLNRHRVS